MATIPVILMVLAVLLLGFAAFKLAPEPPRLSFGWGGLFVWALVELFYHGATFLK